MQVEIIDGKPCMIRRGENLVYEILKEFFPKARFQRQKNLTDLCAIHDPTERQQKETIDIVMLWNHQKIAIRVQNDKGDLKMLAENRQKDDLIESEWKVVDISEYESKNVFKEKKNYMTYLEIFSAFFRAGVNP